MNKRDTTNITEEVDNIPGEWAIGAAAGDVKRRIGEEAKYCPVSVTQNVLMGKWKLAILWIVSQRTRRFNELQRLMPNITRGVLTQQLRELERDGLVHREIYREIPPKVEYSLTEIGSSFIPVMMQIMEWGAGYVKKTANCNMDICVSNKFSCQRCYELMKASKAPDRE